MKSAREIFVETTCSNFSPLDFLGIYIILFIYILIF